MKFYGMPGIVPAPTDGTLSATASTNRRRTPLWSALFCSASEGATREATS
jgi:hypothetical protein